MKKITRRVDVLMWTKFKRRRGGKFEANQPDNKKKKKMKKKRQKKKRNEI